MEERFKFTAPNNCICEGRDSLRVSIYGVRNVGEDREGLSITVIIRTNAPAGVVCRLYRNGDLIKASEEYSANATELSNSVKAYIGDFEV
ncbi:hypothetical protein HMPREF3027_07120 [Porphyromonas sp. HMSC077F02]|uniref:hypothetical protein n=1 Tax=Porphyromonas sp. HMSC077F02 TaxID=1739529 RepID=UPI0008A36D27|nr:hypothetical protein [Porphyromonas sp. HMSC077F02]OFO52186.1 hypothetical protein HMPREF3027_07120 [Porphyromonas sp. HMSC077F02]